MIRSSLQSALVVEEDSQQDSRSQQAVCVAFCLILIGTTIANLGLGFENVFGISQKLISNVCKAIIVASLVTSILAIIGDCFRRVFLFSFAVFIVALVQGTLFPGTLQFFNENLLVFISLSFPPCVCILCISNYEMLLRYLRVSAFALGAIVAAVVLVWGGSFFIHYNMGFSASLIVPVNILVMSSMDRLLQKGVRVASAVVATLLIAAIVLYGSRGALGGIALFSVAMYCRTGFNTKAELIKRLVILAALFTVALFADNIVEAISSLAGQAGFDSRTLSLITSGNGLADTGRSALWETIWNEIVFDPFTIRGISSDYVTLNGVYCHSIVLALWHNLGVVIGSFALLGIVVLAVRMLASEKNPRSDIGMVLLFAFFPVCIWSGDIWTSSSFWIWFVTALMIEIDNFKENPHGKKKS